MFDPYTIWQVFLVEPGHGLAIVTLLSGIWWESRGIKKALMDFKMTTESKLDSHEKKLNDHEVRIEKLETN